MNNKDIQSNKIVIKTDTEFNLKILNSINIVISKIKKYIPIKKKVKEMR